MINELSIYNYDQINAVKIDRLVMLTFNMLLMEVFTRSSSLWALNYYI